VLNLLKDLQNELNLSYLFISHDLGVVRYMSDEVLVMRNGQQMERGLVETVYATPTTAYTQELLEAIPRGWVPRLRA
jgi:peptide/nickel transport system ATP-binding protein